MADRLAEGRSGCKQITRHKKRRVPKRSERAAFCADARQNATMFGEDKTTEFQREYADGVRNTVILGLRKMAEDGLLRKIGAGRELRCTLPE